MSFKKIRNLGFGVLLVLLIIVGSLPTLIVHNISDQNRIFSEDMEVLENISIMNNMFWAAANQFNQLIAHSDGSFDSIVKKVNSVIGLLKRVEEQMSSNNHSHGNEHHEIIHSHANEHDEIIKQLKRDIQTFRISVIRYQQEFESDQTADQTFQLEKLAYGAFERTNDRLLDFTKDVSKDAHLTHLAINHQLRASQIISICALIAGIIFAILVILKLNSALNKPVNQLLIGAKSIEKGKFDHKIKIETADEFGQLARAFNSMSDNLKHYIDLQKSLSEQAKKAAESEKRKSEELVIVAKMADKANQTKSEFLSNMSHELRTPLNHIIGFTELVVDKQVGELSAEQEEFLNTVLESSKHLLSLVNDILDISKVEAGKLELDTTQVNIRHLLENGLIMVKEKAMKHGIQLTLDTDGIPEEISADERKLKQIYYNLLANAVKFTPDQGSVKCKAGYAETEGFIEVAVIDSGIGIDADDLDRIFDPFEQADGSMSRQFEGTGLGLSLTKKFVELHGGRIWAESDGEGQGATFRFTIPLNQSNN